MKEDQKIITENSVFSTNVKTIIAVISLVVVLVAGSVAGYFRMAEVSQSHVRRINENRDRIQVAEARRDEQVREIKDSVENLTRAVSEQTRTLNKLNVTLIDIKRISGDVISGTEFRYFVALVESMNPEFKVPDIEKVFLKRTDSSVDPQDYNGQSHMRWRE